MSGPVLPRTAARAARQAAAVFAGALLVRLLYILSIRHAFFFDHLQTEPQRYDAWAAAILRGAAPAVPPFDEAPAYPYLVALLYALFGRGIAVVAFAQAGIDAASCAALSLIGRRWNGAGTGWVTGVLAALYGPLIYFTGQLEPATLAVFAVSLALWATPEATDGRPARWSIAGAVWAAALLVRSEIVLALPLLLLHAWLSGGRRLLARAAAAPALLLCASMTLNAVSSHHLVLLTTGSGVNLWLGNNPQADGVNPFLHGPLQKVAHEVGAQARDAVEADAHFRDHALAFFRQQPGTALHLVLRKFLWLWTARELPNATDIDWQTGQSWLFHPPWFPPGHGVLLPLCVAGALLLGRGWRQRLLLAAPLAIGIGTSVLFFTNARFRLVMAPAQILLAGLALTYVARQLPAWRERRSELARAAAGAALGLVAAWANFYNVRGYQIPQIAVNIAVLERGAGDLPAAIRHLREGLRGDPQDPAAWVQLALTFEQAGRPEEARATWLESLRQIPWNPMLRRLAASHLRRGLDLDGKGRGVPQPLPH